VRDPELCDPFSGHGCPKAAPPVETSSEPGKFSIDSAPYATIYLDGNKLGDTPLYNLKVSPGRHQVRAVLADGRDRTFAIDIKPGQATNQGRLAW